MFITLDYLEELDACGPAREWLDRAYPDGVEMTRESLATCPDPAWVWWLACRLDRTHTLVWVAANVAFREAAKVCTELAEWVGRVGPNNWQDAAYAARAAAYATRAARAATRAAAAAAYAAADAAAAAADAAYADAAAYAADAAIWNELREIATEFLLSLGGE